MPAGKLRWCYANANRCWRWASELTNHKQRQDFLDMAREWRALALKEQRRAVEPSTPSQRRPSELNAIVLSGEAA